jgi:hypothetical protein
MHQNKASPVSATLSGGDNQNSWYFFGVLAKEGYCR